MGRGAQAGPIRQERPGRLCGRTASWFFTARLSLGHLRTRTLVTRTLLADAVLQIPRRSRRHSYERLQDARAYSRFFQIHNCRRTGLMPPRPRPGSNPAPAPVVDVCVVAPVQFIVAVAAIIVVRAIATIASNEERYPLVFLVESRVWSGFDNASRFTLSRSLTHTCFFLLARSSAIHLPLSHALYH